LRQRQRKAVARARWNSGSNRQPDLNYADCGFTGNSLHGADVSSSAPIISKQSITILGATGSVGKSTLDVVARHRDKFRVYALSAHKSSDSLLELCIKHEPVVAVLSACEQSSEAQEKLRREGCSTRLLYGADALLDIVDGCDIVLAAIVGAAGLAPALKAARAGKKVLLANKEALVMAGPVFMEAIHASGASLLPIDSEHNAVFQCLPIDGKGRPDTRSVNRILLTASGGPFRTMPVEKFANVTPAQACAHPNWSMGRKISVDSATMMNKGLEVIEAKWMFDIAPQRIEVVIHPESIVHSMVEYLDGSVLAQMSNPDMRVPIANALGFPERIHSGATPLDLVKCGSLTFERPDLERFPCLQLAFEALREGGTAPAILNAANEIAVEAFLSKGLSFPSIFKVVASVMDKVPSSEAGSLEDVFFADANARHVADSIVKALAS